MLRNDASWQLSQLLLQETLATTPWQPNSRQPSNLHCKMEMLMLNVLENKQLDNSKQVLVTYWRLLHVIINFTCCSHQPPKCHHSCCHAELRKSDLDVTARHLNEVEAVQHVHLINIPVWSDCCAISETDARKIDALDQWCLHMLLGIKWYQFVRNDDVRRLTKQPKLTAIIQSRRLTLFGHIMCMDNNADAKMILLASPPADWRRQLGRPASRGSAPSNRIWNITTLRSPKQQIWLRIALCGGWCRRLALHNRELHARNDGAHTCVHHFNNSFQGES